MLMEICRHNFQIDVNELVVPTETCLLQIHGKFISKILQSEKIHCPNRDMPTTNTWKVHIEDFTKLKNTLWAEF